MVEAQDAIANLLTIDRDTQNDNWGSYDPEGDGNGRDYVEVDLRDDVDDTRASEFDRVIIYGGNNLYELASITSDIYDQNEVVRIELKSLKKSRLSTLRDYIRDTILIPNYATLSSPWSFLKIETDNNLNRGRQYRHMLEVRLKANTVQLGT